MGDDGEVVGYWGGGLVLAVGWWWGGGVEWGRVVRGGVNEGGVVG